MKPKTVGRVMTGPMPFEHARSHCPGFPVGLPIATADGILPVEYLTAGDRIITRNGGLTPLIAITASTHNTRAVKFASGAFGDQGPEQELVLPADQPVLLRGDQAQRRVGQAQVMVSASDLVNDADITDIGERGLVLFALQFDRPRVVYASGLELGADLPMPSALRRAA